MALFYPVINFASVAVYSQIRLIRGGYPLGEVQPACAIQREREQAHEHPLQCFRRVIREGQGQCFEAVAIVVREFDLRFVTGGLQRPVSRTSLSAASRVHTLD